MAVEQFQRVGQLGRHAAGQAARHDVEMAAVEHLQGHGLEQDQGQQDHQQAAAEQRARQDALDQAGGVEPVDHPQAPGFRM